MNFPVIRRVFCIGQLNLWTLPDRRTWQFTKNEWASTWNQRYFISRVSFYKSKNKKIQWKFSSFIYLCLFWFKKFRKRKRLYDEEASDSIFSETAHSDSSSLLASPCKRGKPTRDFVPESNNSLMETWITSFFSCYMKLLPPTKKTIATCCAFLFFR